MRKYAVFTHHSKGGAQLAEATLLNHWRYSLAHNYDFIVFRNGWPEARRWVMEGGEVDAVSNHEAVMAIGSDVVFTNMSKPFHVLCDPNFGLIVTREHWAPRLDGFCNHLNCGSAIYQNNEKFRWYIAKLKEHCEQYLAHPWYHQELMIDLLGINGPRAITTPYAKEVIKVIAAREMNSAVHPGAGDEGKWQPGDMVAHCYAIPEGQPKLDAVNKYLSMVQ